MVIAAGSRFTNLSLFKKLLQVGCVCTLGIGVSSTIHEKRHPLQLVIQWLACGDWNPISKGQPENIVPLQLV